MSIRTTGPSGPNETEFKNVSHNFFNQKNTIYSISVTSVFLRVVSKVSSAIGQTDIYKMFVGNGIICHWGYELSYKLTP